MEYRLSFVPCARQQETSIPVRLQAPELIRPAFYKQDSSVYYGLVDYAGEGKHPALPGSREYDGRMSVFPDSR